MGMVVFLNALRSSSPSGSSHILAETGDVLAAEDGKQLTLE
jgi:hypothetical protein